MKTTKLTGVTLYESTDTLPEKLTREGRGRLSVGQTIKILGVCHVAETKDTNGKTTMNAWDGILVEDQANMKQFPVSYGVLLGVGFTGSEEKGWKVVETTTHAFVDSAELTKTAMLPPAKRVSLQVLAVEPLTVQKYGSDETVEKNFYTYRKL